MVSVVMVMHEYHPIFSVGMQRILFAGTTAVDMATGMYQAMGQGLCSVILWGVMATHVHHTTTSSIPRFVTVYH